MRAPPDEPQGHGKIVHADFVDAMLQYCMEKMDPNVHTNLNTPEIVTTTDDGVEEEDTEMPEVNTARCRRDGHVMIA